MINWHSKINTIKMLNTKIYRLAFPDKVISQTTYIILDISRMVKKLWIEMKMTRIMEMS
jgi:hypothetical protein